MFTKVASVLWFSFCKTLKPLVTRFGMLSDLGYLAGILDHVTSMSVSAHQTAAK